jgi:hypothetical protein
VSQERYALTDLVVGGVDVPLATGHVTRASGAAVWHVRAEGVTTESFAELVDVIGPDAEDALLEFTDVQGACHEARCHVVRRNRADPGFNLSTDMLTFSCRGPID